MVFSVEFDESLYFQGFDGILGWIVVIFDGVGSDENGVKWAFCRSVYRSGVLGLVLVKCLGNADFIRGLWIEQMYRSWQPAVCSKM